MPLLSETTAVNVAILSDESESEENQVRVEVLVEKEEIDGACVSTFVKLIVRLEVEILKKHFQG